jgi:branched-chain amino acid transport system ATP-binding protein
MLEMGDVHAGYGGTDVLKGLCMQIGEGEIVTLIGANGAGKTTALMTISGIVPVTSGEIRFQNTPIQHLSPHAIVRTGITQVPEGRRIFPFLTVMENLDMGAFHRNDKKRIKDDLAYVFELFPILWDRRHQTGGTLSGGEQQMLAISRAIMARPKLLLLDEPSLGLSPLVIRHIFEMIRRINREHRTTILLVEQNAQLALQLAHRGYVMESGTIALSGPSETLMKDKGVQKAYLGM